MNSLSEDFGGVESLFFNLIHSKIMDDMQMDFTCSVSRSAREEDYIALGAKVFHIKRPSKQFRQYIRGFTNIFSEGEYSIYHVNLTRYCFPLDIIIAKLYGVKVVLHCHSTQIYDFDNKMLKYIRKIEQILFKPIYLLCSDLNIACSVNAGKYLFKNQPCKIVHNGIELERFYYNEKSRNSIRDEYSFANKKVIGHIGRFSSEKNHIFILRILRILVNIDDTFRLLCVGSGELFNRVVEMADAMGLKRFIVFTGQRNEDIHNLLSAMDVFLLPSIHEALPIVLIEAQANGLPCIVSNSVTSEVDILNTVSRLSLDAPISEWKNAIQESIGCREKIDDYTIFRDFDIVSMKQRLYSLYVDIINEK